MKNKLFYMVQDYIDGEITLGDLEKWYVPYLMLYIDNPETCDFIAQLELDLAELNDGLITEDNVKNNLKAMLKKRKENE